MATTLVTYFSATGTTKRVAERLAKAIGADLDWRDDASRSNREHRDRSIRPAMKTPIDVSGYGTVFVGYPLWWETAPRVVHQRARCRRHAAARFRPERRLEARQAHGLNRIRGIPRRVGQVARPVSRAQPARARRPAYPGAPGHRA